MGENITLTKLTWRLDSRKSFMLAKLQTRNIEIQKRVANGSDYAHLLPDNLKEGKVTPPAASVDTATTTQADVVRASAKDVEVHLESIKGHLPADDAHEPAAAEEALAPADPPADDAAAAQADPPVDAAAEPEAA